MMWQYVNIYFTTSAAKKFFGKHCSNVQIVVKKLCCITNLLFRFLTENMGSYSPPESSQWGMCSHVPLKNQNKLITLIFITCICRNVLYVKILDSAEQGSVSVVMLACVVATSMLPGK